MGWGWSPWGGVGVEPDGVGGPWGGVGGVGWGVYPVRRTGTRYNAAMRSGVLQYGAQNRVAVRASRDPF